MAFFKRYSRGRKFWKKLWIGAAVLMLLLGGCAKEAENKAKTYGHDGYLGYTNSNPNLLNRSGTLFKKDMEQIGQLLKQVNGVEKSEVGFNGDEVHVTLRVNRELSEDQQTRIRAEAQSLLQSNMPRYDVHVKVKR